MIVLALSGWKGSGKDTLAETLIKDHKYIRFSFADVLKEMVAKQYGIPVSVCHTPETKEAPLFQFPVESEDNFTLMLHNFMIKEFRSSSGEIPTKIENTDDGTRGLILDNKGVFVRYAPVFWTPRALCILEGSVKRSVSSEYWVEQVVSQIDKKTKEDPLAKFVITDMRYQSEVGQLSYAFGENLVTCRINRFSKSPSSDPSERDLDDYSMDFQVDNKGTLSAFNNEVEEFVYLMERSRL